MKILFTGGSSFTGYWFIKELVAAGHDVVSIFRRQADDYSEQPRQTRVREVVQISHPVYNVSFGDNRFREVVESETTWDLLCHHGADSQNYRSPEFDAVGAAARNVRDLSSSLTRLQERGCHHLLLTGSVFESNEGGESRQGNAVSPYGLSKTLTTQVCQFYAQRAHTVLGKFVIPNPFGPYENAKFTSYLMRTWRAGQTAMVNTPDYVRDNIHVTLLAKSYVRFAATLLGTDKPQTSRPSGYVETQGDFARRFGREIAARLPLECELQLAAQTHFDEPRVRVNRDRLDAADLGWREDVAWDQIAHYYDTGGAE